LRVPLQLSEESLFGFLASTRLPLVSSLSTLIRWISLGLGVGSLVHGVGCFAIEGTLWSPELPWSGALPSLVASPLFLTAWRAWRRHRLQAASTWLFLALFALTVLANWPRGAFSAAWYLHPVLALMATMCLGVIPGLSMTLAAVSALLLATALHPGDDVAAEVLPDVWIHAASLSSVTLASALAGAIVNRLVFMTLLTAESQRRKNLESSRALRHREKLLRHALRVETIGDLAGMVCHQLRNTFQVLMGHVALGNEADDEERKRRMALIEETLQQSQPLLDQLMRMAHPDEGKTEVVDLAALLRQFERQAQLILPHNITLSCETPEQPLPALLNAHGMMHVLWNLAINARQAIKGEGSITLRCGQDRHQVWVEVADTGSGIPKDVQSRIFDPYFTTKPMGQGTGLGLTAVARFVRGSNGIVQVESEPGHGTVFRLRFPLLRESANRTA
jgi:signal transduction histidine kinase